MVFWTTSCWWIGGRACQSLTSSRCVRGRSWIEGPGKLPVRFLNRCVSHWLQFLANPECPMSPMVTRQADNATLRSQLASSRSELEILARCWDAQVMSSSHQWLWAYDGQRPTPILDWPGRNLMCAAESWLGWFALWQKVLSWFWLILSFVRWSIWHTWCMQKNKRPVWLFSWFHKYAACGR